MFYFGVSKSKNLVAFSSVKEGVDGPGGGDKGFNEFKVKKLIRCLFADGLLVKMVFVCVD